MAEIIVQMAPMLVLGGLIMGWLAQVVLRPWGDGFIPDTVLGLARQPARGAFVWLVIWRDAGMTIVLLVGCTGAALAILAQRGIWPSARAAT